MIDFSLLKHQVQNIFHILVILNDSIHGLYSELVDRFFPKMNGNFVYAKVVKGFQEAERKLKNVKN